VPEGNIGTVNATFTVRLSAASSQIVTVAYQTTDGSALAGSDYVSRAGTLTFAPNTTTQIVTIAVNGDTKNEDNETFFVSLSNASNAIIANAQGMGTILDNDPPPTIRISDVTMHEGSAGVTNATFTVALSVASGKTVTVAYRTADNTAVAPGDYGAVSGTLTFLPGTTTQVVTIAVNADTLPEPTETFFVNLTNPINGVITDGQGVGTILDGPASTPQNVHVYLPMVQR
jgi:Calx-beta domain-containing protein